MCAFCVNPGYHFCMASPTKFRDKWRIQLQVDGRRVSKVFETEAEAEHWAQLQKKKIKAQSAVKAPISRIVDSGTTLATAIPSRVLKALSEIPHMPHEIVDASVPMPFFCGVYFLVKGKEIVYVGQSVDILGRVSRHHRGGIDFDAFCLLPCKKEDMDRIEATYIAALMPDLNISLGNTRMGF
jgi:hypothetical protein